MSKALKISLIVLAGFTCISVMHVWLNIGFSKLGILSEKKDESFRVGFLPVT